MEQIQMILSENKYFVLNTHHVSFARLIPRDSIAFSACSGFKSKSMSGNSKISRGLEWRIFFAAFLALTLSRLSILGYGVFT